MRPLRAWVSRVVSLFSRGQRAKELDDELRAHLALHMDDNLRRGMSSNEARRVALAKLGGLESIKEEWRDQQGLRVVDETLQDARYGVRLLLKSPGFTFSAVLCLALGIGGVATTFGFANALLFAEPAVSDIDRLVRLSIEYADGQQYGFFSYPDYEDFRDEIGVFTSLVHENVLPLHLSTSERNEKIWGFLVSGDYFSALGVETVLGRGFLPGEDRTPGTHPVTVISHALWLDRLGARSDVIGETLRINNRPFTIVGVAGAEFHGTAIGISPALWVPMMMYRQLMPGADSSLLEDRGGQTVTFVTGRLRPEISISQARAAANALMGRLAEEYPNTNRGRRVALDAYPEGGLFPLVRGPSRAFFALMIGVVSLVLLIACVNVAGLLLARGAVRSKEIRMRLALGATRSRLVRQLLSESVVLAAVAGGVGLGLALISQRLFRLAEPPGDLPVFLDVRMDPMLVVLTVAATVGTVVVFGLFPALQATKTDLASSFREGAGTESRRAARVRQGVVASQVALSLILLVGTGLLTRSMVRAAEIDPGFQPNNVAVASFDLALHGYGEVAGRQFVRLLGERLTSLPGVRAVGFGEVLPLSLTLQQTQVMPEGHVIQEGMSPPSVDYSIVDPGYFRAMGIPIVRGRVFLEDDDEDAPQVVVVNEAFSARFWPGEDAVGRRLQTQDVNYEVVGIVPTGKYFTLGEDPKPFLYYAWQQRYRGGLFVQVRTSVEPSQMLSAIRSEILTLDASLPVSDLQTMNAALAFALLPARLAAGAVGLFAALAAVLAAVGLYGAIAYTVSQQVRDIAIRRALGANTSMVLWSVVREGAGIVLVGLGIGFIGCLILSRVMPSVLYGVGATDPVAFATATVALLVVAVFAALVSGRKATLVEPVQALRLD